MTAERDLNHGDSGARGPLIAILACAILLAGLQGLPADWRGLLQFEREGVAHGELWRLLTANVVHLGWRHLALNFAGLGLILWIFGPDRPFRDWLLAFVVAGIATSLGVYFAAPDIYWMVGLSGLLHGLFVVGACGWLRNGDAVGWLLLAGVAGKLVFEQLAGAMPMSADIVGGAVVVDAHLWGAAGGLLAAAVEARPWRRWQDRSTPL